MPNPDLTTTVTLEVRVRPADRQATARAMRAAMDLLPLPHSGSVRVEETRA